MSASTHEYISQRSSRSSFEDPGLSRLASPASPDRHAKLALPPISAQRQNRWRKLSSVSTSRSPEPSRLSPGRKFSIIANAHFGGKNRRTSCFPFPVTAWLSSDRRLSGNDEGAPRTPNSPRPYRTSRSQEEMGSDGRGGQLRRKPSSWNVSLLVNKAKGKFSGEEKLARRRISLSDFLKVAVLKQPDHEKKKMIRDLKRKALQHKKDLLNKFRNAVKITIFCSRLFKEHCLRLNENNDQLAPYIKRLHFHEDDDENDLLIDLSKFKANRQMRIPEETKRILSKMVGDRTEQEIYSVTLAMRNLKSFAEYPNRMQKKIAEVGLYEKYESKRVVVRQSHPASAFYFLLSGAVVVMVMDEESNYARPVAHLYKGQTFGELAIINGTKRFSTVICKETCEFLSISKRDYHKIFMAGGVKNINDPDQEVFLKSLSCLVDWPIHILPENPTKCQFLFFKNCDVIVRDSHYSDWLVIVKSGSVQVLKKLKRVEAFEWKKKQPSEQMNGKQIRELTLRRMEWRRFLPELRIPLHSSDETEDVKLLGNGRPEPFEHPSSSRSGDEDEQDSTRPDETSTGKRVPQNPSLWPFKVDISEVKSGQFIDDGRGYNSSIMRSQPLSDFESKANDQKSGQNIRRIVPNRAKEKQKQSQKQETPRDHRSDSVVNEEETELLGYQPHIRTIMEDIDAGIKRKDSGDIKAADINPEFVHVQTLTKGQVFGLTDLIIGDQPSFSVVSRGADCLLINKQFYIENASEKLLREMRQQLCPYPTEEELQERLQVSVDWEQYKKTTLHKSLEGVSAKRHMKHNALNGTKTQEAFAF